MPHLVLRGQAHLFTVVTCTSLPMPGPKNGGDWALAALATTHADSCSLYVGGRPGDITPGPQRHPNLRSTKENARFGQRGFFSPSELRRNHILNNDNTGVKLRHS